MIMDCGNGEQFTEARLKKHSRTYAAVKFKMAYAITLSNENFVWRILSPSQELCFWLYLKISILFVLFKSTTIIVSSI